MKKGALQPRLIITNLTAGLIAGLIFVVVSVSFSTLIFNGAAGTFLARGIGLFLFGIFILGLVLAFMGKFSGITILPQDGPAALMGVAAGAIATSLAGSENIEAVYYTILAAIILTSLATGLTFFLIGQFNLGNLVRYIPYPVVGGFLAGTGWLITLGAIEVMIGESVSLKSLGGFLSADMLIRWLPGTLFALLFLYLFRKFNHYLLWPGFIASAFLLFHGALLLTGTSLPEARSAGLLLPSLPSGRLWSPISTTGWSLINWNILAGQLDKLIPIPLMSLIAFLLNGTGLELIAKKDMDLNHELRSAGIANMVAGLGGSPPGYHVLSITALARRMGAQSPVVTLTTACVSGAVLLFGGEFISYLPVALLSSLLLVLGLSFLIEWVYDAWFKLAFSEYLIVLISLAVIAYSGFLQGVLFGIFAATIVFVFKYSRVNTVRDTLNGQIYHAKVDRPIQQREILKEKGASIQIFRLQGYIFFGTADNLYTRVRELIENPLTEVRFVLLDFHRVHGFDSSAVSSFSRMMQLAANHEVKLVITQVFPGIRHQMELGGFSTDETVIFLPSLDHGVEWCENRLLDKFEVSTQFIKTTIKSQLRLTFPKPELIDKLLAYLERMEVKKDYCLMQKGDTPDSIYFIESGRLNVYIESNEGESLRIRSIRSGTVVGELGLYLRDERTANVYADQDSVLYRLKFESMTRMEKDEPDVASALHEWIAGEIAERMADNNRALEALLD